MKDQNSLSARSFARPLLAAFLLVILLLPGRVQAQAQTGFEGTIQYAIRLTGKYAQDFMKDMPANRMTMHIKDDNFIVSLTGGQRPKTFLFVGDSNHTYIVDGANKRAFLKDYYVDTTTVIPTAEATDEVKNIKGYECKVFKVKKEGQVITYYVSDKFRVDLKHFAGKDEAKVNFLTNGLDGMIPLRTTIKSAEMTTEIDMLKIARKEFDKQQFLIPPSFKIKGRDPR